MCQVSANHQRCVVKYDTKNGGSYLSFNRVRDACVSSGQRCVV